MNGFGYSEQQKKKSGSNRNKYVTVMKPLKIQYFSDLWKQKTLE